MKNFRDIIFSKAFRVIPGIDYNRVSYEMREKHHTMFYEVALQKNQGWSHLRDNVCPSLARYLKLKSMDPETGKGIVISLFSRDRFYLIQGPEFYNAFREVEGITQETFRVRLRHWLAGDRPKLLGSGNSLR